MRLRRVIVGLVASISMVVAGCDEEKPPVPGGSGGTEGGEIPPAEPVSLSTNASCTVQGDLEGQFSSSAEMSSYLECVIPHVEQWIDAVYGQMPHPSAYWFVPEGAEGEDSAGCTYDSGALKYCFDHETIYMGEAAVWKQYTTYGDAASVVVLAHEVTHHFQSMSDMPRATVPNEQVRYENQADCGAGAFIAWAETQQLLDRDDDIADLAGSLMAAGASEGPDQDHGTIEQRLGWFDAAYLSGLEQPLFACNELVSEVDLIA